MNRPPPCRLRVLLARQAPKAVILRRGPAAWVELVAWDTLKDRFERGQWFHGRIYEDCCDLSPDGTKLIYFAAKFGRLAHDPLPDPEISESWTAISKPPYFTALALWPHGSTWGGGGLLLDDVHFWNCDWHDLHPRFSLGPLRPVSSETAGVGFDEMWKGERSAFGMVRDGWQVIGKARNRAVRLAKRHPRRRQTLVMEFSLQAPVFQLLLDNGRLPPQSFAAEWADWDHRGRLVMARHGKLWAGSLDRHAPLHFEELADFNSDRPENRQAPPWAQHW